MFILQRPEQLGCLLANPRVGVCGIALEDLDSLSDLFVAPCLQRLCNTIRPGNLDVGWSGTVRNLVEKVVDAISTVRNLLAQRFYENRDRKVSSLIQIRLTNDFVVQLPVMGLTLGRVG